MNHSPNNTQAKDVASTEGFSAPFWMMRPTSGVTAASFVTKKNGRTNLTPFTEVLSKLFLAHENLIALKVVLSPGVPMAKTTCLPTTGLLMSHSPDVLCWQP